MAARRGIRQRCESGWELCCRARLDEMEFSPSEPGAWTEALLSAWGFQADASSNPLSALRLLVRSTGADQASLRNMFWCCNTAAYCSWYFVIFMGQGDCSVSVAGIGQSIRHFCRSDIPWRCRGPSSFTQLVRTSLCRVHVAIWPLVGLRQSPRFVASAGMLELRLGSTWSGCPLT